MGGVAGGGICFVSSLLAHNFAQTLSKHFFSVTKNDQRGGKATSHFNEILSSRNPLNRVLFCTSTWVCATCVYTSTHICSGSAVAGEVTSEYSVAI